MSSINSEAVARTKLFMIFPFVQFSRTRMSMFFFIVNAPKNILCVYGKRKMYEE